MKETTIKISVTQDGLLPEEVTLLGKIFIPPIQKQILRSTGFEKIDDSTYAGVMPVKIIANSKLQEIEFEIGAIPDFRKKVVEFVNVVSLQDFVEEEPEPISPPKKKAGKIKKDKAEDKKTKPKAKKVVTTNPLKSKAKKLSKKKVADKVKEKKKVSVKKAVKKVAAKKNTSKKKVTEKKITKKNPKTKSKRK